RGASGVKLEILTAALLGIFALGSGATARGDDEPVVDVPGYEALSSSHEASGDPDGFLKALCNVIAGEPASPAASLALLRIQEVRADASDVQPLAPALERALQSKIPDARTRDRALAILASLEAEAGSFEK